MHWIRRHHRGRPPHPDILTPAEWRVLEHIRQDLPNAEIAVRLGVSVNTVRAQVSSILAKTGLPDRHALAAWDGRPAEASRSALARFGLGGPFGWSGGPASALARVAAVGGLALAGALVVWYGASLASGGSTGGGGAMATATPTVAATPDLEPAERLHTAGVETGIADVDFVANSVLAGDVPDVIDRLRFFAVECVERGEAIGHPPVCEDGEAPGTPVDVFHLASEVPWQREPAPAVAEVVRDTLGLHAIAHGPTVEPPGPDTPVAEYVLVFSRYVPGHGECGYSIDVTDGDIVSLWLGNGCREPDDFLARYGERLDVILAAPIRTVYSDPFAYCRSTGTLDRPDVSQVEDPQPVELINGFLAAATGDDPAPEPLDDATEYTGPSLQWRCVNSDVLVCMPGATGVRCRQPREGAQPTTEMEEYCEEHPQADGMPNAVTGSWLGRETIYRWGCRDASPDIVARELELDARGFIVGDWVTLAPPSLPLHAEAIRAAVVDGDGATLASAAHLLGRPCGGGDTGGFPCPPGIAEGTPVQTFLFVACHGEPRFPEELELQFALWLSETGSQQPQPLDAELYAAFEFAFESETNLRLVFVLDNGEARWLDVRSNGEIQMALRGCGPTAPEEVVSGVDDFIVSPPAG